MRTLTSRTRCVALITLVLFTTSLLGGCFSEHQDGATEPVDDPSCPAPAAAQGKTLVRIKNYAFSPDTVRIARNATVFWLNCDNDTHTSTSDTRVWDSPIFVRNQTFERQFANAGSFPYHCTPHPTMRAVVIVQ